MFKLSAIKESLWNKFVFIASPKDASDEDDSASQYHSNLRAMRVTSLGVENIVKDLQPQKWKSKGKKVVKVDYVAFRSSTFSSK